MTLLPFLLFAAPPQLAPDEALAKLGYERAALDRDRVESPDYAPYDGIYSMQGGQRGEAYYPSGVSSRRYVVAVPGGPKAFLLYQERVEGRGRTVWSIRLERTEKRGPQPKSGTLQRMLWQHGFRIRSRLTNAQRSSLTAVRAFAGYSVEPVEERMGAWMVNTDGSSTGWDIYDRDPRQLSPSYLPLVAEEVELLGLGSERWYVPGEIKVTRRED